MSLGRHNIPLSCPLPQILGPGCCFVPCLLRDGMSCVRSARRTEGAPWKINSGRSLAAAVSGLFFPARGGQWLSSHLKPPPGCWVGNNSGEVEPGVPRTGMEMGWLWLVPWRHLTELVATSRQLGWGMPVLAARRGSGTPHASRAASCRGGGLRVGTSIPSTAPPGTPKCPRWVQVRGAGGAEPRHGHRCVGFIYFNHFNI